MLSHLTSHDLPSAVCRFLIPAAFLRIFSIAAAMPSISVFPDSNRFWLSHIASSLHNLAVSGHLFDSKYLLMSSDLEGYIFVKFFDLNVSSK